MDLSATQTCLLSIKEFFQFGFFFLILTFISAFIPFYQRVRPKLQTVRNTNVCLSKMNVSDCDGLAALGAAAPLTVELSSGVNQLTFDLL